LGEKKKERGEREERKKKKREWMGKEEREQEGAK